jgi:DNA-binding transcriptional regulator YiaG
VAWRGTAGHGKAGGARHGAARRGKAGEAGDMTSEQLKRLRSELGLSLAEAARMVEVTPRTWARWESGERAIPRGAVKLFYMVNNLGDPPND